MRKLIVLPFILAAFPSLGAVKGTIMTSDGAPIAGARIEAHQPETSAARADRHIAENPRRAAIATATTDASGNFSMDVKKQAVVDLAIEKAGYEPMMLTLGGEEDAGAIPLRAASTVVGEVSGGGKPLPNARLIFRSSDLVEFIADTDAEGRFSVPDPKVWKPGLSIHHPDYATFSGTLSDRKSLKFQLQPGKPVTGRVLAEDGKTPVAGAKVRIGSKRATSADDGSFSIDHLRDKRPPITAVFGDRIGTDSGDQRNVTIKLFKGATVSGVVRDARTQRPLAGVMVSRDGRSLLVRGGDSSDTALTDGNGAFTLKNLPAGRGRVTAVYPNYSFAVMEVDVRAGEHVSKMITATPDATIIGSVIDEGKKAVAAARVVAAPTEEGGPGSGMRFAMMAQQLPAYSAPDGRYVLRNVPADQQVEVTALKKGTPSGSVGPFKLAGGEVKRGVSIALPRGITVVGKVIDRKNRPIAGVTVVPTAAEDGLGVRRMMIRGRPGADRDSSLETAADGTFTLQLKSGRHDLAFRRPGYAPKRVRGYNVTPDPEPLEVTLDPGVEITGRVVRRDGSGVPDVAIIIMADFSREEEIVTGADGSFTVPDLAPGSLMLMAMKPDEFIREMRNLEAPASNVIIEIPPGGRVEGRVVEKSSKRPVTQFRVSTTNAMGGRGMTFMGPPTVKNLTNEDGSFVLESVPVGKIDLMVDAAGFVQGRAPALVIEEGKVLKDIEIELEPGIRLFGKVTGPDGEPLSGVAVREERPEEAAAVARFTAFGRATTDGSGEYTMEAVEAGEKTFLFQRDGFISERKTVKLAGKEHRLDVRLGRGKDVAGTVVDDQGMPVANANVTAMSGAQDAGYRSTRSDSNGQFRFEGLAPGRYTFRASKTGYVTGDAKDIDLDAATAGIRITLSGGGVIFGYVRGLSEEELSEASVSAVGPGNRRSSAPVKADGTYRIEGAPAGSVRVNAQTGRFPSFKTSQTEIVEVSVGSEVQRDLEFPADLVIRGRVTRQGSPTDNAMVMFDPRDARIQTRSSTRTDASGSYEISGLERGTYGVEVIDLKRSSSFSTSYEVTGSSTFDIEIRGIQLRGRVIDADSGEPIAAAAITLMKPEAEGSFLGPPNTAASDASGNFVFETVSPGTYRARAQKERYGQAIVDVTVGDDQPSDLELKMTRIDGVRLRVVDARDGRALGPFIWIRDQQDRLAYEGSPRANASGVFLVPLAPGGYRATISASGYAARTISLVVPSQEIRVPLTPGGSILIQSNQADSERAKLMTPTGDPYQRAPWARAEFVLHPGTTNFDNMAPGAYVLQLLDDRGNVKNSYSITVVEGQLARLEI